MTETILRLPFTHGDPAGPLRRETRAALRHRCPAEAVEDAVLVISELVQNVSQHTRGDGVLAITGDDRGITVEVTDEGSGVPRIQPPDDHRIGGRGLLLVAGICSDWGTVRHRNGKTVWARIDTPVSGLSAAA